MSHNNSYGNYAGSYLNECLPNIKGALYRISETWEYNGAAGGAFSKDSDYYPSSHTPQIIDTSESGAIFFDADRGAVIRNKYLDMCYAIRPKSYVVYMWVRTN